MNETITNDYIGVKENEILFKKYYAYRISQGKKKKIDSESLYTSIDNIQTNDTKKSKKRRKKK